MSEKISLDSSVPISHFLYHYFYKNGNLIKYMLLLLSLLFFISMIDNVWRIIAISRAIYPYVTNALFFIPILLHPTFIFQRIYFIGRI